MSRTTVLDAPQLTADGAGAELLTRGALEALQLERLQWTVRHAYESVALYRRCLLYTSDAADE